MRSQRNVTKIKSKEEKKTEEKQTRVDQESGPKE